MHHYSPPYAMYIKPTANGDHTPTYISVSIKNTVFFGKSSGVEQILNNSKNASFLQKTKIGPQKMNTSMSRTSTIYVR
ncbi:MAG: hypothetical protein JWN28_375 [Candidatus Saccharibacteria bacterium]|nr:hypothetical protein [Candidatus Saccharibacteria bacterium]